MFALARSDKLRLRADRLPRPSSPRVAALSHSLQPTSGRSADLLGPLRRCLISRSSRQAVSPVGQPDPCLAFLAPNRPQHKKRNKRKLSVLYSGRSVVFPRQGIYLKFADQLFKQTGSPQSVCLGTNTVSSRKVTTFPPDAWKSPTASVFCPCPVCLWRSLD